MYIYIYIEIDIHIILLFRRAPSHCLWYTACAHQIDAKIDHLSRVSIRDCGGRCLERKDDEEEGKEVEATR